jgi:glycine cleavage system H protein
VNTDPYGAGWMIRIRVPDNSELDALLDADAYKKQIG